MWQERQSELLRNEIEAILSPLSDNVGLYDLVEEPLTKTGRGLSVDNVYGQYWSLLPLIVCETIS